jgi:N4-gp56 family major capsid protein
MAITQTTDVLWDQTGYELLTHYALRASLVFNQFATVQPTDITNPGATITMNFTADLASATTPLTEATDLTPVTLSDSQVSITLNEYGNVAGRTRKLRAFSYIPTDPVLANTIGFNAGNTLDDLAIAQLQAGANVIYASTAVSRVTVGAAMVITSNLIRKAVANLRANNVMPWAGGAYAGVIHPLVAYDLYSETGAAAWRDPHNYSAPENIWNSEVGLYQGVRFMEVSKAPVFTDAGVGGTVDPYGTLIFGQEALAKTWSRSESGPMPEVVISPTTDKLKRFYHVGWYWLGGFARFRSAALYRIESSSSIGANT